jgi:hypothetical protein
MALEVSLRGQGHSADQCRTELPPSIVPAPEFESNISQVGGMEHKLEPTKASCEMSVIGKRDSGEVRKGIWVRGWFSRWDTGLKSFLLGVLKKGRWPCSA